MKKHQPAIKPQQSDRPARKLFGLSQEELSTVHGGGGVIINGPKITSGSGG